jgi:hypothetical protein
MLCRYVRAYILHLFDNLLFIDLTKRYVSLIYLTLLEDFDVILTYSWGSAVLICLYIHQCLTCMNIAKQVGNVCYFYKYE